MNDVEENPKENMTMGNPGKGDQPFLPPGLFAVMLNVLSKRQKREYSCSKENTVVEMINAAHSRKVEL